MLLFIRLFIPILLCIWMLRHIIKSVKKGIAAYPTKMYKKTDNQVAYWMVLIIQSSWCLLMVYVIYILIKEAM